MPGPAPAPVLGLDDGGEPLVMFGGGLRAADLAGMSALAPHLWSAEHATDLARAANHLAHGTEYRLIEQPAAFADDYRARVAGEDPDAEWREGIVRLRDFGVPDFRAIEEPKLIGGALVFYVADVFLGVPYKVVMSGTAGLPEYDPLPLTPCSRPTTGTLPG